jgi:predicted RNA binding protein YcfA (HicA-like mRNA interferase family)
VKVREMMKVLEKDGWTFQYQRGSHRYYVHSTKPAKVTLAGKPSDEIKPGTLAAIRRQAELKGR